MIVQKLFKRYFFALMIAFTVSACGGGGGSGSTSGGGTVTIETVTYNGVETLIVSIRGIAADPLVVPLTIRVTGSSITLTNVDGTTFTGSIDAADKFTATGTTPGGTLDGITCSSIPFTYVGTVTDTKVTALI